MLLCDLNNLWAKREPQIRKQCWEDITAQYNAQKGTNFTKPQVVMRYQNYKSLLKRSKANGGIKVPKEGNSNEGVGQVYSLKSFLWLIIYH